MADAEERAREEVREAQEKLRQAQETLREQSEKAGGESRQGAEKGRKSGEDEREVSEGGRETSETGREVSETAREGAEKGREKAEGIRQRAFEVPAWVPRTKRSAVIAAICMVLAGIVPAVLGALYVADRAANQANEENVAQTKRVYTEICLQNNITKAVQRNNERRRLQVVTQLAKESATSRSPAVKIAREGVEQVEALLTILNCDRTFEDHNGDITGIGLSRAAEQEYLRLVRDRWVPELDGGKIVGKHRAEQEGHADF